MKTSTKVILVTAAGALPSFLLSGTIWPDVAGAASPTPNQLPFFIFLSMLESVAFGLGIAFLVWGWRVVSNASQHKKSALSAYASIAWLLISWWPHDNMHRVNGEDMAGLLRIEYMFHFTLIVAAALVAWHFVRSAREA